MGQSFILFYRKDGYFVKKVLTGGISMNTNAAYQVPVQQRRRRISRQEMLRRKRAIRRRKRIVCFLRVSFAIVLLLTAVSFWQDYGHEILPAVNHLYYQLTAQYDLPVVQYDFAALREENESDAAGSLSTTADTVNITESLAELAQNNAEAADFVADYPNRQNYLGQSIDLASDVLIGQVPLLLQWDKRWGYESYGDSIIGLAGCGPTCLSMVYVYFTHDLNGTPREIASYCEKNGYYTENGTSWSLWTEGLPALGLSGKELPLGENSMKTALDQGKLIVCSMRPGDFTSSGHYILLYDYDDTGFCVKDPNRVSNSSRTWDYDTLSPQIKNLWTISPTGF